MFVRHFSFNTFRSLFTPRKPRHPLLRLVMGLLGLGVLCVLVFFSVFVGAAMIAAGLLYRVLKPHSKPVVTGDNARDGNVVEGEYRVVRKPVLPL